MTVLQPYLPRDGPASSPYEIGGGLYALGLIHANHGASVTDYLLAQTKAASTEVTQHGACLGLGLAAMASGRQGLCV